MTDCDVVIAGGGHNALICACVLAKNGLNVMVVERNPWVGGGVLTREVTLPGFKHDLFGSSHVWIHLNPDFQELMPEPGSTVNDAETPISVPLPMPPALSVAVMVKLPVSDMVTL